MSERKSVTPVTIAVDVVLCAAFFALIYWLVHSHVQSSNPVMIVFWGALTSACMTGVFWLCIQMFRVVLRAQREARARG